MNRRVKFGDVVREVKMAVDRNKNPYEFYVAGDHMDTDDLDLHRRGCFATDDVGPAFIRVFRKGQVLYGSRRTYLRKVAVADFDGVTANTTFVLEPRDPAVLRQDLLPFLMLSPGFTRWSVSKSRGSTNPYVLFSDLAGYEFSLPPPGEQRSLADRLWALHEARKAYRALLAATDELVKSQFVEWFGEEKVSTTALKNCCSEILGGKTPSMAHPEFYGGGIPFIKSGDIREKHIQTGALSLSQAAVDAGEARFVPSGSVVVVVRSAALQHEFRHAITMVPIVINQDLKALVPKPGYRTEFLYHSIAIAIPELLAKVQTMVTSHINLDDLLNIPVPDVTMDSQNRFSSFVTSAEKSKFEIRQSLERLDGVYRALLAESLG